MKNLLERVEEFWCRTMHGAPLWPSHGRYQCRVCLREFPIQFEKSEDEVPPRRNASLIAAAVARRA